MARICSACSSDARLAIDEKLRAGESAASVARSHDLSSDAVLRHKKHLRIETLIDPNDPRARLEQLRKRIDETYAAASRSNNHKLAVDSLKQLANIESEISKLEGGGTSATWAKLNHEQKLELVLADRELCRRAALEWWDAGVKEAEHRENSAPQTQADNRTDMPANPLNANG